MSYVAPYIPYSYIELATTLCGQTRSPSIIPKGINKKLHLKDHKRPNVEKPKRGGVELGL